MRLKETVACISIPPYPHVVVLHPRHEMDLTRIILQESTKKITHNIEVGGNQYSWPKKTKT